MRPLARFLVPAIVVLPTNRKGTLPVTILLNGNRDPAFAAHKAPDALMSLVTTDQIVVIADLRTFGGLFRTAGGDHAAQHPAWQRNSLLWGRPVPGMAVTDLRCILDYLESRSDADMDQLEDRECVRWRVGRLQREGEADGEEGGCNARGDPG